MGRGSSHICSRLLPYLASVGGEALGPVEAFVQVKVDVRGLRQEWVSGHAENHPLRGKGEEGALEVCGRRLGTGTMFEV